MHALSEADVQLLGELRACNGLDPAMGLGHRTARAAADRIDELLVENWRLRRNHAALQAINFDLVGENIALFNPNREPVKFQPLPPAKKRWWHSIWRKP